MRVQLGSFWSRLPSASSGVLPAAEVGFQKHLFRCIVAAFAVVLTPLGTVSQVPGRGRGKCPFLTPALIGGGGGGGGRRRRRRLRRRRRRLLLGEKKGAGADADSCSLQIDKGDTRSKFGRDQNRMIPFFSRLSKRAKSNGSTPSVPSLEEARGKEGSSRAARGRNRLGICRRLRPNLTLQKLLRRRNQYFFFRCCGVGSRS